MTYRDEYRHWPQLTQEEFDLACSFFDQKYVRASLGPTRQIFKIRQRRTLTTGTTYLEILRILQLPEEDDELSLALAKLGGDFDAGGDVEMDTADEDADTEALHLDSHSGVAPGSKPPGYSLYPHQPYVKYEVHLHSTYSIPTLWFSLHDLPNGEPTFDLDSVYRYLVPPEFKSQMRAAGVIGAISAAPHPVTDLPAFFIHPCQTTEAMGNFDCPMTDYIIVWLGLVGSSVGLWVPPQLVGQKSANMS